MGPLPGTAARRAAARLGTPLWFYDLPRLRDDALAVRDAFPDPWIRLYALKANGLPGLVREVAALGFGASVVSRGELGLARRAAIHPTATVLEGVGKSRADLAAVVRAAVAGRPLLWTSLESPEEAAELARLATAAGLRARLDVLVRVNPMVAPETRRGLAVGAAGSKFGVLAGELPDVVTAGGGPSGPLRWRGIHLHVGSQLGAVDAWRSSLRLGLRLLALQRAVLPDFDTLDAGGGFPVAYGEPATVPSIERFGEVAREELPARGDAGHADGPGWEGPTAQDGPAGRDRPAGREGVPLRLAVEPGRSVVAGCGWLLGRVLHVRARDGRAVVIDAGMTELLRPALYGAEHPAVALTSGGRALEDPAAVRLTPARLHGPVCESTDVLGDALLPPLQRGDLLAIGMAGAYGSSMASTYNGRPRAPEVAWDGERTVLLRPRGRLAALP